MKRSKFTESQIIFAIRQSETGVRVEEVCRKMGISEATFYNPPTHDVSTDKAGRRNMEEWASQICGVYDSSRKKMLN